MGKLKQLKPFYALSAALLIVAALIGTARWYFGADDHVIAAPAQSASTVIHPAFDPDQDHCDDGNGNDGQGNSCPTSTPTDTPTPTETATATETSTATFTATATNTAIPTETPTSTPVPTETATATNTATATATATNTATATPTDTPTNTPVPSETATATNTATATATNTPTPTESPTNTPTATATATETATPTATATNTPTPTETATPIPTETPTPVPTETQTPIPTETATNTPVPTETATPIPTETPTPVPTDTATPTATVTATQTPVSTATPTPEPTATSTAIPTATPTATSVPLVALQETPVTPAPTTQPVQAFPVNARPGQLNVLLREGADPDVVAARHGGEVLSSIPALNSALFGFPVGTDMAAKTAEVLADPDVIGVEANGLIQPPEATTKDTESLKVSDPTYGYELVGELEPGCVTPTGIIVAVIDTGIDPTHPAFAGKLTNDGWNVLDNNADFADIANGIDDDGDGIVDEMYGHGTHVAGIIARLAPTVKILPIKALNDEGIGDSFGVATGIVYAYEHGANVINLSLSSTQESAVVDRAIQAARERGIIVVASAGNSDRESPKEYPSASPGVIGVAATGPGDIKSPFSSYGAELSMSAPGTEIESAIPGGGYGEASGTSMAAPFVTAAVALVMEKNPEMNADDIEALIESTSASLDTANPEYVGKLGSGRLDIAAAVDCGTS